MLGKQHVSATIAMSFVLITIIIFQYFNHTTSPLSLNDIISTIFSLPLKDYIYLGIFEFGLILSSTAPDVDVSSSLSTVKQGKKSGWMTFVKYTAYMPLVYGLSISKRTRAEIGHRKIFHSFYGMIMYTISIVIFFIIILFIGILIYNIISFPNSAPSVVNNLGKNYTNYIFLAINILKENWNFVYAFLVGSATGFICHLYEDSTTVSGIIYLPFITDIGLKGKLKTGNNEFYVQHNVRLFRKTSFGVAMFYLFSFIFLFVYFHFNLFTFPINYSLAIYIISLSVFLFITTGLRISKIHSLDQSHI